VSLLEEYYPRKGYDPSHFSAGTFPELSEEDEEQEWDVEAIIDHKQDGRSKHRRYLIKWKDWPEDHNTWLPAYPNLNNSQALLDAYLKNHSLEMDESGPKGRRDNSDTDKSRVPKKRRRGRPRKSKR